MSAGAVSSSAPAATARPVRASTSGTWTCRTTDGPAAADGGDAGASASPSMSVERWILISACAIRPSSPSSRKLSVAPNAAVQNAIA